MLVFWVVDTNVSEQHTDSIFRAELDLYVDTNVPEKHITSNFSPEETYRLHLQSPDDGGSKLL
jgi:hypothetical protein